MIYNAPPEQSPPVPCEDWFKDAIWFLLNPLGSPTTKQIAARVIANGGDSEH